MTKIKKVLAVLLTLLMILSSVTVAASAFDPTTDGGTELTITAEILKEIDGTWTAVDKVKQGDSVKVRVSLGTDYYSNSANLLFFYDSDFFSDSYGSSANTLTVNDDRFEGSTFFTSANTGNKNGLIARELVDSDYLADYNFFAVMLKTANGTQNFMYDDSDWLFEFDLTVNNDAEGTGEFFVKDSTVMNGDGESGYVNVPKGPSTGSYASNFDMWLWKADFSGCSDSVTIDAKITLNPQGGTWTADSSVQAKEFTGNTGDEFTAPAIAYEGKTLLGWYDDDPDTLVFGPEGPTAFDEYEDLVLNAKWIDKVEVTFSDNYEGGTTYGPYDVTPGYEWGTEHTTPADPTRTGYEFRGWSTNPADSAQATFEFPDVYGSTGATYYAIWAKQVTMTFVDALTGTTIGTVTGYAGDTITATIPTAPTHEGYYLASGGFMPAVPATFPAADATYTANYEAEIYHATYTVTYPGGATESEVIELQVGADIPTEGVVELRPGFSVGSWKLNGSALASGATMPRSDIELTADAAAETYEATFLANGGKFADDTTEKVVDAAFGAQIAAPADPTYEGYTFKGWTPFVGELYVAEDVTFTATWEANLNTITYAIKNNDVVTNHQVYEILTGDEIDVPADPVKEGSEFIGWNTDPDAETGIVPTGTVNGDVTYYAIFGENAFTITFATAANPQYSVLKGPYGSTVTMPEDPTLEGNTFAGWVWSYEDDEGTLHDNVAAPETIPAFDMTATATFTPNDYTLTITYQGAGDDTPTQHTEEVTYGENYTVDSPVIAGYTVDIANVSGIMPAENVDVTVTYTVIAYDLTINYVFADNTQADVPYTATLDYKEAYSVTSPVITGYTADTLVVEGSMPAENTTVTVTYTVNQYTLTVNFTGAGDLTPATHTEQVDYGAQFNYTVPAVEGYTPDVSVVTGTMDENGYTATVTYTRNAVDVKFFVDYADGEGFVQVGDTVAVDIGQPIVTPTIEGKTGYTFSGWYVGSIAEGNELAAGAVAEDPVSIYAQFTINSYTISYLVPERDEDSDIGEGYGTLTGDIADYVEHEVYDDIDFGDEFVEPEEDPEIDYYEFLGWSTDGTIDNIVDTFPATMPAEDVTYYAAFRREAVYLKAVDGSTGVVDRYDDGEADIDTIGEWDEYGNWINYWDEGDWDYWFVYGLALNMRYTARRNDFDNYIEVNGDGYYEVLEGEESGGFSTGAVIVVYDNITGEVVEQFYVVVFGDIEGDGRINAADVNMLLEEIKGNTTWSGRRTKIPYLMKAADIDSEGGDGRINAADLNVLYTVMKGAGEIDQELGCIPEE